MTRPHPIYLDYAATTPLSAEVADGMQQALQAARFGINPASQHTAGCTWHRTLEMERELIARALGTKIEGMQPDRVVFTSGGTEANNLALFGLAGRVPCRVMVSAIEHPSVSMAADELKRRGFQVDRVSVRQDGVLDLDHLRNLLDQRPVPRLVSVMCGNNETGVLQPIVEVVELCRRRNSFVHSDAVQVIGKSFPGFARLGVDALTVAPHKFCGPVGIGALVLHHDTAIEPQLFGGFQQEGIRPGTESFPLVVGFRDALENVVADTAYATNTAGLRDRFELRLREQLSDLVINGESARRLPHISNIAFLGIDRQQLFLALDFAGVYCSTGSACASGSSEPSPVLRAMGLPDEVVASSLRFSFGCQTTPDEIDEAVERITPCVKRLRRS